MTLLVDTSVWSLALRRDTPHDAPEVAGLQHALRGDDIVVTTGLILQELLQGLVPQRARTQIVERLASLPLLQPDRDDHISAAGLRNTCRKAGVPRSWSCHTRLRVLAHQCSAGISRDDWPAHTTWSPC